jgi:hypothetical protein
MLCKLKEEVFLILGAAVKIEIHAELRVGALGGSWGAQISNDQKLMNHMILKQNIWSSPETPFSPKMFPSSLSVTSVRRLLARPIRFAHAVDETETGRPERGNLAAGNASHLKIFGDLQNRRFFSY